MAKATIIGTTTWGKTLGKHLALKGNRVTIWARSAEEAGKLSLSEAGENLSFSHDANIALKDTDLVIWAVPSHTFRENVKRIAGLIPGSPLLISASKGFEMGSNLRMSQVLGEEVRDGLRDNICVLSGPNLAREIARGLPAQTVIASLKQETARKAKKIVESRQLVVFTTTDVTGVELGGSLKNVIALGAGMVDGLELGDNVKAAFIAEGWAEAVKLARALGARSSTLYGLSGLGDLIATCQSSLSRNHQFGFAVARGKTMKDVFGENHQVVEGINTTRVVHELTARMGIKTPIINIIYGLIFESLPAAEAAARFQTLG